MHYQGIFISWVRKIHKKGNSYEIYFGTPKPTSIYIEIEINIIIHTNPARDYIEINFDSINPTLKRGVDEVADIQIFDMLGVVVTNSKGNPTPTLPEGEGVKVDVSILASGVYFIKIGNRVEKFVKM